jgi:hypothetical protein
MPAGLFFLQRALVAPVADEVAYHFSTYVFSGSEFPAGDLDNGRLIRRGFVPVRIVRRFFDARFREVTRAEHPGRYGAVVRIDLPGARAYRFITLYRLPQEISWDETPLRVSAQLPAGLGLDPAVVKAQPGEIGELLAYDSVDFNDEISSGMAVLLAGLSETAPSDPPAVERTNAVARDAAWWYELRRRLGLTQKYPYLVDLPADYRTDSARRWPLILYLHNADEQGTNLRRVRKSGLAGLIQRGKRLPAIVVSPQAPLGEEFSMPVLEQLLDEVCARYRVDPDRVYLTGISAGGDGTWDFAAAHPERLAAIVPICGEGNPSDAARLRDLPVWAFHGINDQSVPVVLTVAMVDAIRRAGGHPHLTLFPHTGHNAWDQAYALDALFTWLLAQKRGQPEIVTPGVPPALQEKERSQRGSSPLEGN